MTRRRRPRAGAHAARIQEHWEHSGRILEAAQRLLEAMRELTGAVGGFIDEARRGEPMSAERAQAWAHRFDSACRKIAPAAERVTKVGTDRGRRRRGRLR